MQIGLTYIIPILLGTPYFRYKSNGMEVYNTRYLFGRPVYCDDDGPTYMVVGYLRFVLYPSRGVVESCK
jgi:hypothetical protein